ncbi:MAG TPA: hypothetical protein VF582_03145 [Allosphingosinicella sp.]
MRGRVQAAALGPLSALACACDSPPAEVRPIEVSEGGYRERIERLKDEQRDALFLRAVRDAGHDCQGVAGSAYNGVHFGMPSWAARCTNGEDWLIMLGKGGRAHVARRQEATPSD